MRGFILQATYRGSVVWLIGRLEDGRKFLARDSSTLPHFYVPGAGALRALDGTSVTPVRAATPRDLELKRERYRVTYEADVRLTTRFLMDRKIRGAVEIAGEEKPPPIDVAVDVMFDNAALTPVRWAYQPTLLSIDIETDGDRILSVALVGAGADEVLIDDEPALLRTVLQRIKTIDPDVITGWNVIDFDLTMLAKAAERHRIPFELGRMRGESRPRSRGFWFSPTAHVPGRIVLDALQLMRASFVPMEEYSLDFVARQVLGEGKTITHDNRPAEIVRMFNEDREAFIAYNRADARLVLQLLEKLQLMELTVERSLLTGLPLDRVGGSIAAFDFLYIGALHERGCVAPTLDRGDMGVEPNAGGLVLEPKPGLYTDVCVLDFKSLYPSVMRTFAIDPLGFAQPGEDPIVAPNGAKFAREAGILPSMLDALMPEREAAKQRGDAQASYAIKILMNSFYGVLGTPACRFHSGDIANAITSYGREILLWTKAHIEARGHEVIYGDTDSLFVRIADARQLVADTNAALAAHVAKTWRVDSKLELQLDTHYAKLWLQQLRQGEGGARKRYAGLLDDGALDMVGMEAVRRDWTALAKDAQRELCRRLFLGLPVEAYVADLVDRMQAGRLDEQLVYKKSLRKPLESYTATTPPHVAAARKLGGRHGRLISYVMTTAGPQPLGHVTHPPDYAHYLEKQLRPIAEPVFDLLGLRIDRLIHRQLSLF